MSLLPPMNGLRHFQNKHNFWKKAPTAWHEKEIIRISQELDTSVVFF